MNTLTERDPLLQSVAAQPGAAAGAVVLSSDTKSVTKVGPLEITRSTRYGILAGIWVATFLSVCNIFRPYWCPTALRSAHCSLMYARGIPSSL